MKLNIQLFAGSVSIGTITETTDINTNQSTFTIPATMTTTGATYNNDNAYMTLQWKYASSSSWTSLSKQTFGIGKNSSKTKSWTLTLDHNSDGTLENINFRVKWYITDSTNGTTGTTTKTPTTIPRASEIDSVTNGTTPYYPTIKWTPKSSSFKYKVKYYYRNNSYTSGLITPNTTNQYTYNSLLIPNAMFNGIQATPIEAIAELYTYQSDGTTQIGTAATKTFTVTLNSSIKPNLGISNLAEADSTMISKNWGIYVQGKSKLSFHLGYAYENPTPSSSTVTATTNGQTFSSTSMNGYLDYTTSTLKTAGTNTLTATIIDSRNRSATDSETYNVVAYSVPTINTAQVQRCDINGNVDKNGQYCLISYNASISSCDNHNKASAEYKVGYRVQNTGSYTYVSLGTNANSKSVSGMLFTDGIKSASSSGTKVQFSDSTYDIQFYVKDTFTTTTSVQPLDAGFDLMNFNPSGKAMAIGKVSEASSNQELLEVALPTTFNQTYIKDELIVESIRSKNILNPKFSMAGAILDNSTSEALDGNTKSITSAWIKCEPNTQYTISGGNNRQRWQTKASNGTITFVGAATTITTNSTANWLRVYYYYSDDNINPQAITNVQIEKGNTATTFSPFQELNYNEINFAKVKYFNLGATSGVTTNTGIPTNKANGFAGIVVFMKGSEISLVPFGRRWWTSNSSYSALITTNSTLVKESTNTWTLTLTTTSTSGEKVLVFYSDTV